jgi:YaiO family outer membrane protein
MDRLALASRVALAALALLAGDASATAAGDGLEAAAPVSPLARQPVTGFVEAGAGYHGLSGENPSWNDQYLRSHLALTARDGLDLELSHQAHFGDRGTFLGAGYTRTLDDRWYASAFVGGSTEGFFLPRARIDGFLSRKWLTGGPLVTTVGAGFSDSRDVHWDTSVLGEASYYFRAPFIVNGGMRLNVSNPGAVVTTRGFGAVTWGAEKRHYLTLRIEGGGEGYQVVGEQTVLAEFSSFEASAIWRQWLTRAIGFDLRATRYENPSYTRSGVQLGLFWDF